MLIDTASLMSAALATLKNGKRREDRGQAVSAQGYGLCLIAARLLYHYTGQPSDELGEPDEQ